MQTFAALCTPVPPSLARCFPSGIWVPLWVGADSPRRHHRRRGDTAGHPEECDDAPPCRGEVTSGWDDRREPHNELHVVNRPHPPVGKLQAPWAVERGWEPVPSSSPGLAPGRHGMGAILLKVPRPIRALAARRDAPRWNGLGCHLTSQPASTNAPYVDTGARTGRLQRSHLSGRRASRHQTRDG